VLSPCGVSCEGCKDFGGTCAGCRAIAGKVYWAGYVGLDTCPMYECCINEKGYEHCGHCEKLPCRIYYATQDPSTTDEEHIDGINKRVAALKGMLPT
jgi:hypothetical protein